LSRGIGAQAGGASTETEDAEIGELPDGWKAVSVKDVVQRTHQVDPTRNPDIKFKYVDVSSVSSESLTITDSTEFDGKNAPSRARKAIRTGDVLFATVRPYLKRVARVPPELDTQLCSTAFCVLRADPKLLDSEYLFFATSFDPFVARVSEHQRGSSYPAVTDQNVKDGRILLPPLPEQRAIAHVLRTVQRAKEATEKVITATRQLKASLMRHLFTYGPVPVGETNHVPLRETDYGSLPESWDLVPLGSLISEGPQNGLYKHASCYGDGTPILRIDAFNDGERMERQQLKRLHLSPDEIETYALRENDIVINRVNGSVDILAKAAYVGKLPEPTVFESNMMRLAVDTKATTTRYIICYLLSRFAKKQLREKARVVHQASINQQDLKSLLVPLPQPVIQKQIAHCIAVVERRIDAERARSSAVATLFNSLLHHLMTGKLRVRDLDPTDHSHDGTAAG